MRAYIYDVETKDLVTTIEGACKEECEDKANDIGYMGIKEYGLTYSLETLNISAKNEPWKKVKPVKPIANTVPAQLHYKLTAECPNCDKIIDLIKIDVDDDGSLTTPIFNNRWQDACADVLCPSCDYDFGIKGVVY